MIKLSRLSLESVEKLLHQALEFANGKTVKAKSDIFVANLFLKTVPELKLVLRWLRKN